MFSRLLLSVFFLLPTLHARAETPVMLVVNLNYTPNELAAVKKVAKERGQKLYIIPPEEQVIEGSKIMDLYVKADKALKKMRPSLNDQQRFQLMQNIVDSAGKGRKGQDPAAQEKIWPMLQDYYTAAHKMEDKERSNPSITDQMIALSRQLKARGESVDALVVSGHSDSTMLFGDNTQKITADDFDRLKKQAPGLLSSPRHVMLLGCYSATETAILNWRSYFTGASLVAGFDGRAPVGSLPASFNYITEVMGLADRLDQKNLKARELASAKEVAAAINALNSVRITNSSVDYCYTWVGRSAQNSLSCQDRWTIFQTWSTKIVSTYFDSPPKEDPPRATDGTVLRSYYNALQQLCDISKAGAYAQKPKELLEYRNTMRDATIRMIFWWVVQTNFKTYYAKEIADLPSQLKAVGVDAKLPELDGNTGRKEFTAFYVDVWGKLRSMQKSLEGKKDADSKRKRELVDKAFGTFSIYGSLYNLDNNLPLSWVEQGNVRRPHA